ncbi:MAG TPA: S41 family peptidase, partial [Anaerolineales bacterium]|nr:S41 family peptidase [Anaerolineales bacterium]
TWNIPDAHVGLTFNAEIFYQEAGGSFGLRLAELSDGRVIVVEVIPDTTGAEAGLVAGTEILTWDGKPVLDAMAEVVPYFGPYSTEQHKRLEQLVFLTRLPPDTKVEIGYRLPDGQEETQELTAEVEYESLFRSLPELRSDPLSLPVSVSLLPDSGLGYIRIDTFSDDYHLMAQLWEDAIQNLIDNEVPGLIIDIRSNGGGSSSLAYDFAGYLFDEEIVLYQGAYYNERLGDFEFSDYPARIRPGPLYFEGPVAVLISPYCVSACEGFAYALSQGGRASIVGHYGTAGAFGEVGRGQYELPGEISMQFPTGRPETMDGQLLIEGAGVQPDIVVPVTEASALEEVDAVLDTAVQAVQEQLGG